MSEWTFTPEQFGAASNAEKVRMLDEAIGRAAIAQRVGTGANRVEQADIDKMQATRDYYAKLANAESGNDGTGFFPVEFCG